MVEIETTDLLKALLCPEAYPHRPTSIELVQTQMSFLFLTGDYAYKVKKAVDLGYLNYTTLEKRRFFCHQEVALNRRLAPEVYLGVVKIVQARGRFLVEGEGEAVEYAVKMRQLPRERMLDALLQGDGATPEMLSRVGVKVSRFHREAATSPEISRFGSLEVLTQNTEENFTQTQPYIGRTLSLRKYQALSHYTRDFLREKAPLFQQRVASGRIRDCHGDLYSAHICFTQDIYIYDCIEFNDRFRYCDVASEIAFLIMDLDYHGRPDLARAFGEAYLRESGDGGMLPLLDFYKGYRAYVRGKVEGFKLEDPYIPAGEKGAILRGGRRYFDLALLYTRGGPRPRLLITAGLVGTGKTTLAQALAQRLGLRLISSDGVRKELAGVPPEGHRYEAPEQGIYSAEFTRRTYEEMGRRAEGVLRRGGGVVLDATFRSWEERGQARELARRYGADFTVVEVTCPEEVVRGRLESRLGEPSLSDATYETYLAHKATFEPVTEFPLSQHLRVEGFQPPEEQAEEMAERLLLG